MKHFIVVLSLEHIRYRQFWRVMLHVNFDSTASCKFIRTLCHIFHHVLLNSVIKLYISSFLNVTDMAGILQMNTTSQRRLEHSAPLVSLNATGQPQYHWSAQVRKQRTTSMRGGV